MGEWENVPPFYRLLLEKTEVPSPERKRERYQWADGGEECIQKIEAVHQGPIYDMFVTEDYVITGGKDGKIQFSHSTWSLCSRLICVK